MARRSEREDSNENEPRTRRRPSKSGPPIGPILLLVGLMVGAVVVARMAANRPKADETVKEQKQASDVFGDLAAEAPPTYTPGKTPRRMVDNAPAGLADNSVFQEARKLAKQANITLAEARKAKAAEDHGAWSEKGIAAKELFDKAVTMTADWELELIDKYGDNDRQVDAIMKERSKWFDTLIILHKTTGR